MDTSIQYTPAGRVQLKGKAATKRGKKLQILRARGAFLFLPARCSSDLVHGSWYMLYGCFFSMFMALVLLIDIFFPFFDVPESTSLPVFGQSATWILLILSSFFYTVGTYIMLRAFEDPPKPPLLPNWRHFGSDELLSSWIFLVAALPALPYALFYLQDPNLATNWALVFGAIFLITVSVYFVYCCYPSQLEQMSHSKAHLLPCMEFCCGESSNMARHVSSDWLVACWLIYWACLLATFISWIAIFTATNSRQMFVYISTFFDMLLYLVSSMYFVAGSYPHTQDNTHKDYDEEAKHDDLAELMLLETVENPLVSMYNVFSGDAPRSPRNSQKMDDRGTKYSSVKEQMKHDAEVNNLIHKYAKDKSTTTADNGVGNDDDIEMNLKTPVKTNRFGSTYNVIDTEPIYSNNNSTLHNQQSHVPPLCLPGNTQPSSAPAPQHIHSDRSQASMQGSDTSDKSTLSSSKVTARVRVSKFRNIFSNPAKNEQIYSNIRVANISGDQNFIRANHLFFAVPIDGAGGSFSVFNTSSPGRFESDVPLVLGHKAPVLDFAFNPFSDHILASASEDCTVRLWKIPEGGLTETISTPLITMQGHRKKVHGLAFHPTVRTLLASISADGTAKLWDAEKSKEIHSVLPSGLGFYDLIWDPFGTTYMASMKDKSLYVIDARSGSVAADIPNVHDGNKCIKLATMGDDANRLITVGANKTSMRQCKIWDPRHTASEVCKLDIDNGASVLTPMYDPDTGLLMLAGKGETSIKCYEIPFNGTEIFHIVDAKSSHATKGVVLLPKRNLDVMSCEINRVLKLTSNSVEPVSFFVPRKALAFQDDLYPDVCGSVPPHTLDSWSRGSDLLPKKVPLSTLVDTTTRNRSRNSSPMKM